MSIIQSLREKGAWIMTAFIAFALLVFVIEEGLRSKGGFNGSQTTLGEVDGETIDRVEFEEKMKEMEERYAQQGMPMDENTRVRQREGLWNNYIEEAILNKKYDKLGLEVTDTELGDYLYGANPPSDFKQRFTDPQTQQFDPQQAYNYMQTLKRKPNTPEYKAFFEQYFPALVKMRKREKLEAIVNQSMYVPKWLIEKTTNENAQRANFSFVNISYSTIADSTVAVSDKEVQEYVNGHKELFKQDRAMGFDYVSFSASPTTNDSNAIFQSLFNLKDSFARATNNELFLQTEGSQTPFYDGYISRKEIKIQNIDTIIRVPVGSTFGPYLDGANYTIAKMVGTKPVPEMVKVRHILIKTHDQNPQNGQFVQVRDETEAKNRVDSIEKAIKGGANFDALCLKYSDDGNKSTGGIYDSVPWMKMVSNFNNFIFSNDPGSKGVVKTEFGYHYIEVLAQKGSISAGYKIAYFSKPIVPSEETENLARSKAALFTTENRTQDKFNEAAKKLNLPIQNAADVKPMAPFVPGLNGSVNEIVRWLFNEGKVGTVAENPFFIGSNYVVPVVTVSYEEGIKDVKSARPNSEYRIRQQKKTAIIAQKIGNASTLEEVSKATNQPILRADSAAFNNPTFSGGNEPKVVGAAFNKANAAKISAPITGELGVFVIKTDNVYAVANADGDVKTQQAMLQQQMRMFAQGRRNFIDAYKKSIKIKDYRYKFY